MYSATFLPQSSPAIALTMLPKSQGRDQENEVPSTIEDQSMRPNWMCLRVLKELAGEVAKPLSIKFEKSWQSGEVHSDSKRGNVTPILKKSKNEDLGSYRPASLTFVLSKIMGQILWETILRCVEDREVLGDSQHGFRKCKSCLAIFVAFYNRVTALVENERANDVVC